MRALRILLIVAVVLGGALVGIDRLALSYAESEASSRVKLSASTSDSIEVDIKGFPFLTQVADKRFDEVDVTATGVRAKAGDKDIRVGELTVALRDVTVTGDWAGAKAGPPAARPSSRTRTSPPPPTARPPSPTAGTAR